MSKEKLERVSYLPTVGWVKGYKIIDGPYNNRVEKITAAEAKELIEQGISYSPYYRGQKRLEDIAFIDKKVRELGVKA